MDDMVILFVIHCYQVDQFTEINLVILLHGYLSCHGYFAEQGT